MHDAADLLIKWLPLFEHMPMARCPDHVAIALDVLPRIKRDLARAMQKRRGGGGPRPNIQRQTCAAVVVEAWKLIHGKAEPRSDRLYQACNEYWQACGGEDRGDIDAWRRDAERAVGPGQEWIRKVLTAYAQAGGRYTTGVRLS